MKNGHVYALLLMLVLVNQRCAFVERYDYNPLTIQVNQVGFAPQSLKLAAVVSPASDTFHVYNAAGNRMMTGMLLEARHWEKSGQEVSLADFSELKSPGTYYIVNGEARSPEFEIDQSVYLNLVKKSSKYYYFNRASDSLPEIFAGEFARPLAHPDTAVYIHATAATDERPAGTPIAVPYGWYDAGDYNKYIVNSGITTYTLLLAYEHNKTLFDSLRWNIPESGNNTADLLDEVLWNLRWMERMQDPADGGVYHKATAAGFESFVPPIEAKKKRYVTAKGTAATLDFAAVMARASHVLRATDPDLSTVYLQAARKAWDWAVEHPDVPFVNPSDEGPDGPAISTGEYGDKSFADEFFWAAAELYLATGDDLYTDRLDTETFDTFRVPSWQSVETLGLISLSSHEEASHQLRKESSDELLKLANGMISEWQISPYRITLNNFRWGSNSDILNQGLILINAYRVFGNQEFLDAATSTVDYVLGRNAVGYCFVTGFGTQSPMDVHHRPSASDGVPGPIPGMLVGGPNPGNVEQDCGKSSYPVLLPARCYIDAECSYSTNEVAINWNAPLVYMSASLQSIFSASE